MRRTANGCSIIECDNKLTVIFLLIYWIGILHSNAMKPFSYIADECAFVRWNNLIGPESGEGWIRAGLKCLISSEMELQTLILGFAGQCPPRPPPVERLDAYMPIPFNRLIWHTRFWIGNNRTRSPLHTKQDKHTYVSYYTIQAAQSLRRALVNASATMATRL